MIRSYIRVANHVELQLVCALRQRELELDGKRLFVDRDAFDGVQLASRGVADDHPPRCHLLRREERRDNGLLAVAFAFIVRVSRESNLEVDRRASSVVAFDELMSDVERRIRVHECRDVAPWTQSQRKSKELERINIHLASVHSEQAVALVILHLHYVIHRLNPRFLASFDNLQEAKLATIIFDGVPNNPYIGLEMRDLLEW